MKSVMLPPVQASDLALLAATRSAEADPWSFFGFKAADDLQRRFASDGFLSDTSGQLVIETSAATVVGNIGWFTQRYGANTASSAFNIGITLLPEYRGQGSGTAAQAALVDYLFAVSNVNRIEASTDVSNIAEQRSLHKAGFQREGIIRGAQFRAGEYRDLVSYSRLRSDPFPVSE
jgi:RimJ/RimL family protein N-acetyltransferase